MRMLREEYPQVTVEACASGGGRIDHAVLALCDVVWPSDETGPRDRMRIQDGFLTAYPACVMSSWVTDEPGTDDRLACTLGYRFVVAMAGVLGIGSDIVTWDDASRGQARELVALYKEIRPVIATGRVRVHGSPGEPGYALEYAGAPGLPDRVVVLVYDADRDRRDREVRIRPFGLAAQGSYALSGSNLVVSGASARSAGVLIPWRVAADADVLVFDRIA
jgi:alpha-galactosidase